jgi:prepilin signal peptidase PulO-like enzyme (type II secretory pathway)
MAGDSRSDTVISPHSVLALVPAADSAFWGLIAAVAGAVAGRLLTSRVGGLLDAGAFAYDDPPIQVAQGGTRSRRWMEVAVAAAAVGLWWWEVRSLGLGPIEGLDAASPPFAAAALARCAAHAVLGLLLAAAAWIDIRHRVIPDCVTVPGVMLGLLVVWLVPDVLLPVGCEVPRSFAQPLLEPDVLGWYGGLRTQSPPPWMEGMPRLPGLVVPAAIFLAWWFVCTAPFLSPVDVDPAGARPSAGTPSRRRIEPRNLILLAGLAAILAAWFVGGDRFRGLQSSLIGLAVSAGLVWSIREGASRSLGREAMGLGDVTLMAMVGAWIGWQASVLAFFLAAFIGLLHGLAQVVRHRENELPYGPSLCLASAAVIVGWRPLWRWAGGPFTQPLELAVVIGVVVVLTAGTLFVWQRLRR